MNALSRRWLSRGLGGSFSFGGLLGLAISPALVLTPPLAAAWARSDDPAAGAAAPAKSAGPTLRLGGAVVIGASVSAGFGCVMRVETPAPAPAAGGVKAAPSPEAPAPSAPSAPSAPPGPSAPPATSAPPAPSGQMVGIVLADVLAAASADPNAKPLSLATQRFFTRPEDYAEATLKRALDLQPPATIVFAADYLFWHAYGWEVSGPEGEAKREAKFERGLKRLEQLGASVPMVVGDLPDMRHATLMLRPQMVPTKETLAKLNARLRAWAQGRKNVVILPLDVFVQSALRGQAVTMGGREWSVSEVQGWLQGDGLHATPEGTAALAVAMLHALDEAKLLPEGATWEHDPAAILKRIVPTPTTKTGGAGGAEAREKKKAA